MKGREMTERKVQGVEMEEEEDLLVAPATWVV